MPWADYDSKKKPTGQCCLNCWDTLQEIAPDKTVDDAASFRASKDPGAEGWWQEFDFGRMVKLGEQPRPIFMPQSDVATSTQHGLEIYHKIGLVQETDLLRLTGLTGKQAKKHVAPISLKLDGPQSQSSVLYPISLRGLSADERASMIKGKVVHSIFVGHSESTLKSESQLSKSQGNTLFGITVGALNANKPMMKEPGKILCVQELIDIKNEMEAALNKGTENDVAEDESESDGQPEHEIGAKGRSRSAFSVGSLQVQPKKQAKAKSGAKGKGTSKPGGTMAPPTPPHQIATSASVRSESPSTAAGGSKTKLNKQDRLVEEATEALKGDEEMIRVAKKHLQSGKGSSVKCLALMRPEVILAENAKPGNAGTGAGPGVQKNRCHYYYIVIVTDIQLSTRMNPL